MTTLGRMGRVTALIIALGAMLSALQLIANAGSVEITLFSDNFDRYLLGSFPSDFVANTWEIVWRGRGENGVSYGPSVSFPQSLQLWGAPNNSAVAQRKFTTDAPVIGYEYHIQIEAIGTGGPGRAEHPGFFSREAATWGRGYATVAFNHDTRRIEAEDGTVLGSWTPRTWYRVKVILDRRTNLYSVWIDARLAGQNLPTQFDDTHQINAMALMSGHPGVKVWYDDVRVFTVATPQEVAIRTWRDLDAIRHNLGGHYVLMNDLDATTPGYAEIASARAHGGKGWQPIGTGGARFTGTFDGRGHEVRGLFINRPDETFVGLFGFVDGSVRGVGLVDVDVNGREYVGSIVGDGYGTVEDCYASGGVRGHRRVGGLAGSFSGTVSRSCSSASVDAWNRGGGLVGELFGTITASYSSGSVNSMYYAGGLVGFFHRGTVRHCYSTGRVTGTHHAGGLAGHLHDTPGGIQEVIGSFWDTQTSGQPTSAGGVGRTTAQMKDIATFTGVGWDIAAVASGDSNPARTWNIVNGQTYPFLNWERPPRPPNEPPVASFTFSPTEPSPGQVVRFDGRASHDPDGYIVSYAWQFGDGTTATGATVTHSYAAAGTYTVRLTVTDNQGATGSEQKVVRVRTVAPVGDYGDAPDNSSSDAIMAYAGVPGRFPTLFYTANASTPGYTGPYHRTVNQEWLAHWAVEGPSTTTERDALLVDRDHDDALVVIFYVEDEDTGQRAYFLQISAIHVGADAPDVPRYINVLVDMNRDGTWQQPGEHLVRDRELWIEPGQFVYLQSKLFMLSSDAPVWVRVTLTREPLAVFGWDGSVPPSGLAYGETEDHLVTPGLLVDKPKEPISNFKIWFAPPIVRLPAGVTGEFTLNVQRVRPTSVWHSPADSFVLTRLFWHWRFDGSGPVVRVRPAPGQACLRGLIWLDPPFETNRISSLARDHCRPIPADVGATLTLTFEAVFPRSTTAWGRHDLVAASWALDPHGITVVYDEDPITVEFVEEDVFVNGPVTGRGRTDAEGRFEIPVPTLPAVQVTGRVEECWFRDQTLPPPPGTSDPVTISERAHFPLGMTEITITLLPKPGITAMSEPGHIGGIRVSSEGYPDLELGEGEFTLRMIMMVDGPAAITLDVHTVCLWTLPDLVLEAITHTPAMPTVGQPVTFQVRVRNQGTRRAGPFVTRLRGSGPLQDQAADALDPGASVTLSFTLPLTMSAEVFTATTDVFNQVSESDEANNTLSRTVGDEPVPSVARGRTDPHGEFTVVLGATTTISGFLADCTQRSLDLLSNQEFEIYLHPRGELFSVDDLGGFTFHVSGYEPVTITEFYRSHVAGVTDYHVDYVCLIRAGRGDDQIQGPSLASRPTMDPAYRPRRRETTLMPSPP